MSLKFLTTLLITIGALSFSPNLLSAQEEYTLEQIKTAQRKWLDSIVNFRVKAEVEFEKGHASSKETGATKGVVKDYVDWIWTDSGKARLYDLRTVDGAKKSDRLLASNGQRKMTFWRPHGDPPTKPNHVRISPGSTSGMRTGFAPFTGLWFSSKQLWLAEMLEQPNTAKIIGHNMIEGTNCPQVLVNQSIENSGRISITEYTLTLDPAHDFLPRLVETTNQAINNRFLSKVHSFQEIDPPGIWMPRSNTLEIYVEDELYSRQHWLISEADVNQNFDQSLFEPRIPRGTQVFDSFAKKSPYYQGGKAGAWYRELAEAAKSPPKQDGTTSGVPDPGFWSNWIVPILVFTSLVLLVLATWLRKRTATI